VRVVEWRSILDFTTKRGAGFEPETGFGTLELVIILGLLIVVTAGNPQRQVRRRSEKKNNGRKKLKKNWKSEYGSSVLLGGANYTLRLSL
jgi:hypothetical protein